MSKSRYYISSALLLIIALLGVQLNSFALDEWTNYDAVLPGHHTKVLWEKDIQVFNLAVSHDGTRIAGTTTQKCDQKPGKDYFRPTSCGDSIYCDKQTCSNDSVLHLFDGNGNVVWTYPPTRDPNILGLYNAAISDDGHYIAASVSKAPCHDEFWQIDQSHYDQFLGTGTVSFALEEELFGAGDVLLMEKYNRFGSKETRSVFKREDKLFVRYHSVAKKAEICGRETVLLDDKGKLLWRHEGRGMPKISPNGQYVLVLPYVSMRGMPVYGNSWQLIDLAGKVLMEKKINNYEDAVPALSLDEDMFTNGPFSADGRYFLFDGQLWDYNGGRPVQITFANRPADFNFLRLSSTGLYAIGSYSLFDIVTKHVLEAVPILSAQPGMCSEYYSTGVDAFSEQSCNHKEIFVGNRIAVVSEDNLPDDTSLDEGGYEPCGHVEVFDLSISSVPVASIRGMFASLYPNTSKNLVAKAFSNQICAYDLSSVKELWCTPNRCINGVPYGNGKGILCATAKGIVNFGVIP